ncbi:MAG: DUF2846 domain-containing protein [Hyphomicrobiaceae bacterium]
MRSRFAVLLAAALLLVSFGAAVAQSTTDTSKAAQEKALIYVYRETSLIGIANLDVPFLHIDGRRLTRIRMGGFIPISVSPGQHKLTTTESLLGSDTGKVRGQATVTVPAGATVYLRYSESFKSITPIVLPAGVVVHSTGSFRFDPVTASTANSAMSGMSRLDR